MVGKVERYLLICMLTVFSVVIIPLNNDRMQSVLMLAVMFLCPFMLCMNYFVRLRMRMASEKVRIQKTDALAVLLMLMIVCAALLNRESFRLSTVLYSCLFIVSFLFFSSAFRQYPLGLKTLSRFCSLIVKLYAIVLIFQQLASVSGLTIINESYNVVGLKCNSLSNESSQSGIVVSILFVSFIRFKELMSCNGKMTLKRLWRTDRLLCMSFAYICLMSVSVTCIVCFMLVGCYFLNRRTLLIGLGFLLAVFIVIMFSGTGIGDRIRLLIPALLEMDAQVIYGVDASSAARIAPYIVYFQEFDLTNIHTWIGYGCDYGGIHIYSIMADTELEQNLGVGGLVNFVYDYGLLSFIPLLCLVVKMTGRKSFDFLLFVIIISVCSFNLHILWLYLFLEFASYRYGKAIGNEIMKTTEQS